MHNCWFLFIQNDFLLRLNSYIDFVVYHSNCYYFINLIYILMTTWPKNSNSQIFVKAEIILRLSQLSLTNMSNLCSLRDTKFLMLNCFYNYFMPSKWYLSSFMSKMLITFAKKQVSEKLPLIYCNLSR
jgi:hypothetical protein